MPNEQRTFGDEEYIYRLRLQQEMPVHENNVLDGCIMIDDEKILFRHNDMFDGRATIIMPAKFDIVPEDVVDMKYPPDDRPDVIYTFPGTEINFTLTYKDDLPSEDEDIPVVKKLIQRMVMRDFPESKIIESIVIDASEKTVAYFDFVADLYNLIFFFSLDEQLILGSFDCPVCDIADWKPVFLQILKSIETHVF